MKVDITRDEVIHLVKSITPNVDVMRHMLINQSGALVGTQEKWVWHHKFEEALPTNELWEMYRICTNSWNL